MSQEVSLHHTGRDLDNVVGVGEIQEGMIVVQRIVVEERIGVGIERLVAPRKVAVEEKAVGKLPQVVRTVLVRMIHIPHLVNRYKWLVGEGKESHSATKRISIDSRGRRVLTTHICVWALSHRAILRSIHWRIATTAVTESCLFSLFCFMFCQPLF